MNISKFEVNDLKELMLFLDENLNENYEENVFLNIRQRWSEGFLLVKDKNKIVGACCGAILPNEKLRILVLVLQDNFQKKGIGKKLMNRMIEAAKVFGIRKVTLEARKDSDAILFYTKLGYSSVDVLHCYYQHGCDGLVMDKKL